MDEVKQILIKIVKEQLNQCEENKKVPSKEVLDTIITLHTLDSF